VTRHARLAAEQLLDVIGRRDVGGIRHRHHRRFALAHLEREADALAREVQRQALQQLAVDLARSWA
jgi:hypothetical protein